MLMLGVLKVSPRYFEQLVLLEEKTSLLDVRVRRLEDSMRRLNASQLSALESLFRSWKIEESTLLCTERAVGK